MATILDGAFPIPLRRVLEAFLERGRQIRRVGPFKFRGRCPIHFPDTRGSLSITWSGDRVLVHCFACGRSKTSQIVLALGLRMHDLFEHAAPAIGPSRQHRAIAEWYDYGHGVEKVREIPKNFRWRMRDPTAASGYQWRLPEGFIPRLYNVAAIDGANEIVVVEGEKAVRRLACEGILAVCGAYGASTWREIDTQALQHAGVHRAVILPDNDTPGRKFAERIARACHHGGIVAALVYLPNLDHSGDVVDFLDHGGTPDELRKLLATAPPWDPSASDRERAEHVKALARLRQQNCRARRAAARIAKAG